MSALEGAVAKIVRSAAGVDDEAAVAAAVATAAKPAAVEKSHNSNWARQLEAGFTSASKPSSAGVRRSGGGGGGNPMVKVVGFSNSAGDGNGRSGASGYSGSGGTSAYGGGGAAEYGSGGAQSDISGYVILRTQTTCFVRLGGRSIYWKLHYACLGWGSKRQLGVRQLFFV